MSITERDREVLAELEAANRSFEKLGHRGGWAKPMDCGGSSGSDHCYRLGKLVKLGLAKCNREPFNRHSRPGKLYMITNAGREALACD